jgi:hypothetical protein
LGSRYFAIYHQPISLLISQPADLSSCSREITEIFSKLPANMKNLFFFFVMMIASCSFAQVINLDSVSFIKPGVEGVLLNTALTHNLEAFRDKNG